MKNSELTKLVQELKKTAIEQKAQFWKKLALELEKPSRNRRQVDVDRIKKIVGKDEIAVVPGKVLGTGKIDNQIVAYQWSATVGNNNKIMSLQDFIKKKPKIQNCRIVC